MIARKRCLLAALVGLWMIAPAAFAQEVLVPPPPAPVAPLPEGPREPARLGVDSGQVVTGPTVSRNQKLADAIANALQQSNQLRHWKVEISCQSGNVELTGQVADPAQRDEVLRIVGGVGGVERVRDRLAIKSASSLKRTQAETPPPPMPEPGQLPKADAPPPVNGGMPPEPTPIFQAPPPGGSAPLMQPPRMPPYAWPTYAPYNNYSRVAYPTLYPYQSWPYIGPNYPFPKIPPGWRSISLTWSDGYWWYGKNACAHDWWRIRYY